MPRDGQGVMTKPAGTQAVANTIIESGKYNTTIDDIIADLNAPRPIVAGGTGATDAAGARLSLGITGIQDADRALHKETTFKTKALAAAATIAANIIAFTTLGFAAEGDGGGTTYMALASAPTTTRAWHMQSADGRWWVIEHDRDISFRVFGGVGNWIADDTVACQSAIDYAMVYKKGRIRGEYDGYPLVTQTLFVGNGSATQFSTLNFGGFVKKGGLISTSGEEGYIKWGGALGGVGLQVLGPIQGTRVDVKIDGASLANYGVIDRNCVNSEINVVYTGCRLCGHWTTSYAASGYSSTPYPVGVIQNKYNISQGNIPDIANAIGRDISGDASGMSTWNCFFAKPYIYLSPSQPCVGMYIRVADSNTFQGLLVFGTNPTLSGGAGSPPAPVAGQFGVILDYSAAASGYFPSANVFQQFDVGWGIDPARQIVNTGTPVAGCRPNVLENASELNRGAIPKAQIANLVVSLPHRVYVTELLNRSLAIGPGLLLFTAQETGKYTFKMALAVKTAATAGNMTVGLAWQGPDATSYTRTMTPFAMNTAGENKSYSEEILVRKGGTITLNAAFNGVTGTPVFDVSMTIERTT